MNASPGVRELYERIEAVLARTPKPNRRPDMSSPSGWLGLGVSPDALDVFEEAAGYPLPEDFRSWYLLCDGSMGSVAPFGDRLSSSDTLLSLAYIPHEWSSGREWLEEEAALGEESSPVQWSRGWIPFVGEGTGDNLCMDLDPPPGGSVGQIFDHGHEENLVQVFFPNFTAYLERWALDLESGALFYDADREEWLYDDRVADFRSENPGRFDPPAGWTHGRST